MKYFNFPKEWEVDRIIPKEAIYSAIGADSKLKEFISNNIKRTRIQYILTPNNTNIESYIENHIRYEEILFLKIELKDKKYSEKITKIFHKALPKASVLILSFGDKIMISMAIKSINKVAETIKI